MKNIKIDVIIIKYVEQHAVNLTKSITSIVITTEAGIANNIN
jgi:hypothetical protein